MELLRSSIILIGFKHTGKSMMGKSLANKLNLPFFDLDQRIELIYENQFKEKRTCRQIMQKNGEDFFRDLESRALSEVVNIKPSVISLGGGAPLQPDNQKKMESGIIVHITAPKEIVFERICATGLPAFFNSERDMLESFNQMWDDRDKIYKKIKHFSVINAGDLDNAVLLLIEKLDQYLNANFKESILD